MTVKKIRSELTREYRPWFSVDNALGVMFRPITKY